MFKLLFLFLIFQANIVLAVPCDLMTTFSAAHPTQSKRGQWSQLLARGSGTDDMYVMEIDPSNCALPVSIVSGSLTLGYDTNYGVVGATTLRTAAQIGNATGAADFNNGSVSAQTLRTVSILGDGTHTASITAGGSLNVAVNGTVAVTQSGTWTVQPGNTANTTPWLFTINQGGNSATVSAGGALKVDASGSTQPVSGTVAVSNLPTTVDTNFGAAGSSTLRSASIPGNASGIADFNYGSGGAQTLRVAAMLGLGSAVVSASNPVPVTASGSGRTYSDSVQLSYSSTNVTTAAFVQLIASTAAAISSLTIFNGCAESLILATGAAASEVTKYLIPPGGIDGSFLLTIASGTRISVKGITGTCSTGQLVLTGTN